MPSSPINRLEPHWPTPAARDDAPNLDPREVMSIADTWRKRVEKLMGEYPQATVAVAAVAGIALGWFVKRK